MNSPMSTFDNALRHLPLIAILRGIRPTEVEPVAQTLYEQGFRLVEIPLSSPDAYASIDILGRCLPADALFGAGTVTQLSEVFRLRELQASLVVMPHADTALIQASKAAGMTCVPGVSSVTEAFAALNAGADALKLYPAELITAPVVKAMRTVLSGTPRLFPVGGIDQHNMTAYLQAGASGFGLGSRLYTADMSIAELEARARSLVRAWHDSCHQIENKS